MFKYIRRYSTECIVSLWALLVFLPKNVLAALPNASEIAEGADTNSPLQFLQDIASVGVEIAGPIIAGVVSLGVAGYIFLSFKEARQKEEWGKFATTFMLGGIVIVAVIVLALLADEYAAPDTVAPGTVAPGS
jgi:hypothetical protein